jgi:multidrug efflux pump subunit AcrB
MNISTWSIRNPIPTILLFVLLTGLGIMSFFSMKVQNFPDIELPNVTVTASLPGASPVQLETEVARKIENSLASINGLKNIYTTITDGQANITAEFRLEKQLTEATEDVRDAVARVRSDLPAALRDPIISKFNLSGAPILTFAIESSRLDEEALSWFIDNDVSRAMLGVRGVGKVARVGGVNREVAVELDPSKMNSLGATVADVSRSLAQVQQESAGGRTDLSGSEQAIRTIATVQSATQLAAMEIPLQNGRKVRLDQIAKVSDTIAERRSAALMNGRPVVGFEITRSKGAGELDVAQGVEAKLRELQSTYPDIKLTKVFDFVAPVEQQFHGSLYLLVEGAILAVIVVFIFLRDWRATLVAATALPLSVIPTFIAMHYLGFTLNVVSLLSLALVVGVLVDDAIVEIENIVRHLGDGKSPMDAAIEAVEEIGLAVIATTFTLIAVFLPTAFMSGVAGKFFVQFGWTAAIAVFVSLVVARLLTPMMAAYILKPQKHAIKDGVVMRLYLKAAAWCVRHRWLTSFSALAFLVMTFTLVIPRLESGFIPPDDLPQTQVLIELPPGSTLQQTLVAAENVRKIVEQNKEVKFAYTAIGGGSTGSDPFIGAGAAEARKASMQLRLSERNERKQTKQQVEGEIRRAIAAVPGIRTSVGFGGAGEKYVVGLVGDDPDKLTTTAQQLEREIRGISGIGNVKSSASLERQEVIIRPDFAKAADQGITTAAIADTVRVATAGDYEQALAKINLAQRQLPITVKLDPDSRKDLGTIQRLTVPGRNGPVSLESIATITVDNGAAQISRYNRSRNVQIEVELDQRQLGELTAIIDELPTLKALPAGIRKVDLGDVDGMKDLFSSFALAMLIGVFCIYSVLVLLFKDFLQPVTILVALVLSIPGAFIALLIANKAITMPALIGLIMLMGIATKNSILLVEYAIIAIKEKGMNRFDALIDACHKRARPVVMTTIAMGAGMMPLALGFGVDPSFRSPMAVVVIGGLITSTFLSLLVVPVAFTFVDDVERLLLRLSGSKPQPSSNAAQNSKA